MISSSPTASFCKVSERAGRILFIDVTGSEKFPIYGHVAAAGTIGSDSVSDPGPLVWHTRVTDMRAEGCR